MPYTYKQPGNWKTTRRRILERDNHTCACGSPASQVDHVIAVALGGSHEDDNLRAICPACHAGKTAGERRAGMARKSTKRAGEAHPGDISRGA